MSWYDRLEAASGAGAMRDEREKAEAEAEAQRQYNNYANLLSHFDVQGLSNRPIDFSQDHSLFDHAVDAGRVLGNAIAHGVVGTGADAASLGGWAADRVLGADSSLSQSLHGAAKGIEDFADNHFDYHAKGDSALDTAGNFVGDLAASLPESMLIGATGFGAAGAAANLAGKASRGAKALDAALEGYDAYRKGKAAITAGADAVKSSGVFSSAMRGAGKAADAVKGVPLLGSAMEKVGLPSASDLVGGTVSGAVESATNAAQSYRQHIEDAIRNGTYVPGQTEEEARRIRSNVFSDTIPTTVLPNAIETGIVRRSAGQLYN
ncbi:MAG: hypothetical protein ACFN0X_07510, partial [Mitsuokella sp.]